MSAPVSGAAAQVANDDALSVSPCFEEVHVAQLRECLLVGIGHRMTCGSPCTGCSSTQQCLVTSRRHSRPPTARGPRRLIAEVI